MDPEDARELAEVRRELALEARRRARAMRRQRIRTLLDNNSAETQCATRESNPELAPTPLEEKLVANWRNQLQNKTRGPGRQLSAQQSQLADKNGDPRGAGQRRRLRKTQSSASEFNSIDIEIRILQKTLSTMKEDLEQGSKRFTTVPSPAKSPKVTTEAAARKAQGTSPPPATPGGCCFSRQGIARTQSLTEQAACHSSPSSPSASTLRRPTRAALAHARRASVDLCALGPSPINCSAQAGLRCPAPRGPLRGLEETRNTSALCRQSDGAADVEGVENRVLKQVEASLGVSADSLGGRRSPLGLSEVSNGRGALSRQASGDLQKTLSEAAESVSMWFVNVF